MARRGFRAFRGDARAMAAIEFALIVPVLLVLYMGGTDVTLAVTVHRKLQHATETINDLIRRDTAIAASDVDGIFAIADAMLQPYDRTKLTLKTTAVAIDAGGKAKVAWSRAKNATADTKGAPYALPAAAAGVKNTTLLFTTSGYQYKPLGGYGFIDPIDMGHTAYATARIGTAITCTGC